MRILYMGNNWVGWKVLEWLKEMGEDIVGLVVHPPSKRKFGEEIIEDAGVEQSLIFNGSALHKPETMSAIRDARPEIGISAYFGYILDKEFLELMPSGCVNIHPALLPFGRGAYPNVWSIIEETPAGVTMHWIDEGVDTGDIIAQQEVPVKPVDTGKTLYHRLEQAAVDLFKETWPSIRTGKSTRILQDRQAGTYHSVGDVKSIDEIDLEKSYKSGELINIIRARTFPPYTGAYLIHNGSKIYLRLQLLEEQELLNEDSSE